jgi:membrane fusion protein (multidrug efflux system)
MRTIPTRSLAGLLTLLAAAALLTGCGKPPQAPAGGGAPVSYIPVATRNVPQHSELTGRVVPFREAEIRPQVSGLIQRRLFEEGALVTAGQVLYQIDPAPFQAALDNASAALARATAVLKAVQLKKDRTEALLPDQAVSRQDMDNVVAELAAAQAEVQSWQAQQQLARINLGYTAVKSPIAGRIGRALASEGATLTAYQAGALANVQQLDPVYLDLPQSTAELQALRRSQAQGRLNTAGGETGRIQVLLEDGSPYAHRGTLHFREVSVNPATGAVVLRASVPNPDGELLPDMYLHARLDEGINPAAVVVPQTAVLRNPRGNPYAWVVEGGCAQMRQLVLDRAVADQWVVREGLAAGDSLIVEGLQALRKPGTPVVASLFAPDAAANPGTGPGAGPGAKQRQ